MLTAGLAAGAASAAGKAASAAQKMTSTSILPAATIFRNHCSACHGDNGEGLVGPALRPLAIPARDVRTIVRQGSGQMPPFSTEDLPDAALEALITMFEKWQ